MEVTIHRQPPGRASSSPVTPGGRCDRASSSFDAVRCLLGAASCAVWEHRGTAGPRHDPDLLKLCRELARRKQNKIPRIAQSDRMLVTCLAGRASLMRLDTARRYICSARSISDPGREGGRGARRRRASPPGRVCTHETARTARARAGSYSNVRMIRLLALPWGEEGGWRQKPGGR